MSLKQLSIVIPCYNCADTLKEAVDSCYTQGFKESEFEIVMVDDCSNDKTREVMKELAQEHTNIQCLFHSENKGGGAARNTAIKNSSCDVIFCLDSDDLLPPQTLRAMLLYLKEKKCDGVTFNHSINFKGSDTSDISHVVTMSKVDEEIQFTDLFQLNGEMCGLYQVFMFTRAAFDKSGGYPTTHGFDTQAFAWRFLSAGLKAYTCPNTTYLLRVHFKDSYYLREYNSGKRNYNWQEIFLEHIDFFDTETQSFIKNYDCSDFTNDIFADLITRKNFLRENYENMIGRKKSPPTQNKAPHKLIARHSLKGLYLRVKKRLIK